MPLVTAGLLRVSALRLGGKRGEQGWIVTPHLLQTPQMAAQGIRIDRRDPRKHPPRSFGLALEAQEDRLPDHGIGNRGEVQSIGVQRELRLQISAVMAMKLGVTKIVASVHK